MESLGQINKDCYKLLLKNNLLELLIKSELITSITDKIKLELDQTQKKQIKQTILISEKIDSEENYIKWLESRKITEDELLDDFAKPLKIDQYCLTEYSHMAENRFLKRKSSLDLVTYSLVRVEEMFLAQELFFRIEENPSLFGEIASQYSLGHEKSSNGIIGPISLAQGHPGLMKILQGSKVGEVNQPSKIDNVWVITRVEFLRQAVLDNKTKLLLCKEIFEEWLNQAIKEKIMELQTKFNMVNEHE